jgi:aminomethyltransferase
MVRLLSAMDPSFRYAEHKAVRAFDDAEVFYYQGTDFIHRVEEALEAELRRYLGCSQVETRVLSGQMANAVVFSAMVDYLNHDNRRAEPRRIRCVMNHGILRGGHLSSQPMGALRDFVARDGQTEMPAAVNFPVRSDNPFQIDVPACRPLLEKHRPELIIFGKSLVLDPEPLAEIRTMVRELGTGSTLMYDMAHVLGLAGPHFQEPFVDGADLVTGSTHKTFFGTQRGIVAANWPMEDRHWELWEAVRRRTFPGAVSNHHLGTMLGLLMAAYEMNHFRSEYQPAVLANAKAFATALAACGLEVAGDKAGGYTQTHQVLLHVGYGKGPEVARRLEESNIIVNYQAGPSEEGFTAAGYLRMGVAEMTRFGMKEADFGDLAQLLRDAIAGAPGVADKVKALRRRFLQLRFCFEGKQHEQAMQKMHGLIG